MKDKICVLIPTRKRFVDFKLFADSWLNTTEGNSVVVVGIDEDDNTYDDIIEKNIYPFIWERGKCKPMLHILNDLAVKYAKEYKYIGFLEDDCVFISKNWETTFIKKLNEIGKNGIVWGNDLLNYDKVVGVPFMQSSIISRLGYMSNPNFNTQFVDVYWLHLVQKLNCGVYIPDVIIEHRHYITGKRRKDETSVKIQNESKGELEYYQSPKYTEDLNRDIEILLNT